MTFSPYFLLPLLITAFLLAFVGSALYKAFSRKRLRRLAVQWEERKPASIAETPKEDIASYWQERSKILPDRVAVDEITWNDLDMDALFCRMNHTVTGTGAEALYAMLHDIGTPADILERRICHINALRANAESRTSLRMALLPQGRSYSFGATRYLFRQDAQLPKALWMCSLLAVCTVLTLIGCAFHPLFFILLAFCMLLDILVYFRQSRTWQTEIGAVRHLSGVIATACRLDLSLPEELADLKPELHALQAELKPILRLNAMFARERKSDLDFLLDYLRIMLHTDYLLFGVLTRFFAKHRLALRKLYQLVGDIDTCLSLAVWANRCDNVCIPEFTRDGAVVKLQDVIHPMLKNPVPNSVDWQGGVLITGSNASGKSTFARAVAINVILAQSVGFCTAKAVSLPRCRVLTSMALKDNLLHGESYFMVELRSLRRIVEADDDLPILCFIDEILRGTGTVERIAASSALLRYLRERNIYCMAATHDHELTRLLTEYQQVHFRETLTGEGMSFSYQLLPGPADTRNAIALMERMAFPADVVAQAQQSAAYFDRCGRWHNAEKTPKEE